MEKRFKRKQEEKDVRVVERIIKIIEVFVRKTIKKGFTIKSE